MKTRIKEKQKKLEIKENIVRLQNSADRELQETDENFKSLQQSIEKLRSDITEVIRDHEKSEVRNVKELIEQMEKEVNELKRRDAKLAELSQTDDHIYFLKEFPSLCIPSGDGKTPNITINSVLLSESLRKDLSDLNKSVEEIKGCEFVKTIDAGVDDLGHIVQNSRSRNHLLKYSCLLTMNPNTAHRHLCLSEGTRKVTYERTETPYPDHPDRFDFWPQVLCREALSGNRSYWEVEWSGKWTDIGVAYKGISRKGNSDDCLLGYNDKSWRLICSKSSCTVWYNKKKTKISTPCSHRIGVYLDCLAGSLSFFSISDTITLLHRFNNSFIEPIYAGFGLSCDSSITICHLNPSNH
ncbi:TRI16 protein, partial [Polypterus senegalus]